VSFVSFVSLAVVACRETPPPPLVPQVSGTVEIIGLSAPVRVVRDTWGVPHIYATAADDLFLAQGFVQAQDRLFQMDLWRHAVQGRLSSILGANFIERDAMTRRMQYRGDMDAEWASYGPDAKTIATAFVRGINAWVAVARERPPEEFALARWTPDFWAPADVLNRTDAFLASGDALDEIRRRNLSDVVADAVRRVGTAPFFAGGLAPPRAQTEVRAAGGRATLANGVLQVSDSRSRLEHPSARYLVHLNAPGAPGAPGWNVIGAASPWLPGVVFGHNDRVAWGSIPIAADTQDIYVEDADAARTTVRDVIQVKGRSTAFIAESQSTEHGIVIASDRERHRLYTLQWSGFEPGAAADLGALAIDRAQDRDAFREALARWKMPARRMIGVDVNGDAGFQDVALIPNRSGGEWTGWVTLDRLPHGERTPPPPSRPDSSTAAGSDALFAHVLATSAAARQRFNVGPLARPVGDDSPVRIASDPRDWDRSRAINAPGQSGSPNAKHFSDLAAKWTAGELVPLVFSDAAVRANTESTLVLVPKAK
jgi:penicillin amidase